MEKYFELPQIGALNIEHIFYKLDNEPILFVCRDLGKQRYLCSCCKMFEEWVIGQVSEDELLDLIDDKVTIREVLERRSVAEMFVTWDGEKFNLEIDTPEDAFPEEGALLELEYEKTGVYRKTLESAKKQRESLFAAAKYAQTYMPYIQAMAPTMKYLQSIMPAALEAEKLQKEYCATIKYLFDKDFSSVMKAVQAASSVMAKIAKVNVEYKISVQMYHHQTAVVEPEQKIGEVAVDDKSGEVECLIQWPLPMESDKDKQVVDTNQTYQVSWAVSFAA